MVTALVLAVLIGLSLGFLGGGGSILTVPILIYVVGLEPRNAIATSLLVVGVTSLAAMLSHARQGRVDWRVGLLFGASSMVGAFIGGHIAYLMPTKALLAGFTVMMIVTGVAMMRRRGEPSERAPGAHGLAKATAVGVGIGLLTGMVGAGGGFVIVPALVFFSCLPMCTAVGTSLLVIAMNSFAGFVGTLGHTTIAWHLALSVTAAAVGGSLVGAAFARRVKPESLRTGFAWFVLAMAMFMTVKQFPSL